MARKCRHTQCRKELPKAKDSKPIEKAGFCSYDHMAKHGVEKAREQRRKENRKEVRKAKERLKTKADYAKDAQRDFNAYIRERDYSLPCISCGRHHQGQYHAGHYRTVGANPELRFEPLNVHKQCAPCNNHKSGNIVEYRINLRERIGEDNLEWLEGSHDAKRYTIEDLKEIAKRYREKARELKRNREG